MRGFVAAVAAALAVATACASGTSGVDGSSADAGSPGGGQSEAGPSPPGGGDGGGATDAVASPRADGAGSDSAAGADASGGSPVDGAAVDAGANDAGLDADASLVPPVLGSCDPGRWVVSASISAPTNPPAFAVDGLLPTRWSSGVAQAVGQYFQGDFGGLVGVDQIVLDDSYGASDHADYPRGVDVLASADGTTFAATLATAAFATDPGAIVTIPFPASTTRALRIQLNTGVSTLWWTIHELRLGCLALETDGGADGGGASEGGGDAASSCLAPDAGWTADAGISPATWKGSASSTGPNDTIQGAFDENAATRWSSGQAQTGGEWFKVDLGQVTTISGVSLYLLSGNVTDYPSSYALQVSSDDSAYTTVATGLGAPTTTICFPRQPARYVKVTQTGTGDSSWWSIYELGVLP